MPSQQDILAEIRARMEAIESKGSPSESKQNEIASGVSTRDFACGDKKHGTMRETDEDRFGHRAAMRKIERLCATREQASSALRARLVRDGFSEEIAEHAVSRAVECGLVDDSRFADVLVRCRMAAGKGRAGIARELSSFGIDPYSVESYVAAEEEGDEPELQRALSILERKPPRAKNARDAAYRRLVGKGFSSSIASTAARLWREG